MNILIVDDDKYVLEGLQKGIDWSRLPFKNRYEARNGTEARKVLCEIPIQVLLCDIEMPQENGLELLAWLREEKYEIQAIFLTSYADFNYAKRAIQLGSFEYFLKPIEYERLTEVLLEACLKVEKEETLKQYQLYGQYWVDSEQNRRETFWTRFLDGEQPMSAEQIENCLRERRLEYTIKENFVLMAFHLEPKGTHDWRDDGMLHYQLSSRFQEGLDQRLSEGRQVILSVLWKEARNLWLAILQVHGSEEGIWLELGKAASDMRKKLRLYFTEFAIYFSEKVTLLETYEQMARIRQMLFNNLVYGNGIFFVCDFQPEPEWKLPFETEQVELWLLQEQEKTLYDYIDKLMKKAGEERNLAASVIQKLLLDWMQSVFLYLRKKQVEADRLFATEEYKRLYEKADKSLQDCREYLYYLVGKALSYGKYAKESEDIIEKLESYIEEHLAENLSRASLAEVVYLNSDYLAQMFKKEKGLSLMRYINNKRLERSRELLLTTTYPVYTIALQVGFPTSSYFAKQFKERFGIGPNEYRKGTPKNS